MAGLEVSRDGEGGSECGGGGAIDACAHIQLCIRKDLKCLPPLLFSLLPTIHSQDFEFDQK